MAIFLEIEELEPRYAASTLVVFGRDGFVPPPKAERPAPALEWRQEMAEIAAEVVGGYEDILNAPNVPLSVVLAWLEAQKEPGHASATPLSFDPLTGEFHG